METKFKNLEAGMILKGISRDDLVNVLGGSKSSVYRKLAGECRMSVEEAQKVNDRFFAGCGFTVDYLFEV